MPHMQSSVLPPATVTVATSPVLTIRKRQRAELGWLAALALSLGLVGWVAQWAQRTEAQQQGASIRRALEVNALALRGTVARYNYLPYAVAQQPDVLAVLLEPTNAAKVKRANAYLQALNQRAGSDALYVMDSRGTTLVASNWDEPKGFVGQSYANRPYFTDAKAGRSGLFYGVGKTTGIPGFFIATPISQGTQVIGVVAVKVSLRQIEDAWTHATDPIVLTDESGIIFLGSVGSWLYQATRELASEDVERVCSNEQYGPCHPTKRVAWTVERSGAQPDYIITADMGRGQQKFLALDETLGEFGWTLTVMADQAPVAVARNLAWLLGAMGVGVLWLGAMYWRLRERRFVEQRSAQQVLETKVLERTRELRQADAFRKAMEDALPVGMIARDLQGRIIYVNPALCAMVGYSADELVGCLPPYPFWHPHDLRRHWRNTNAALRGNTPPAGFESRMRRRDGQDVYTMFYTAPLVDASGEHSGWMSSVLDLTEQKQADERQRQYDLKMQHTGRLVSLGEIASTLAHELNQPLMALSNFASAAKAFVAQGNQSLVVASLDDITAQAQRAGEIVKRIRGFVKPHSEGLEDCAVNVLVGNVLALLQSEIVRRAAHIVTDLQSDVPTVKGDAILLEQVILNLVLNALQAMTTNPTDLRQVTVHTSVVQSAVCVQVSDQGPGIPPENEEQLFKSFFTTKSDGLGLGLKICRTIVEGHRGRLEFCNLPGAGVMFSVYLPMAS
jgi:two-component system, LuxR family, sensor histidine kinase DctS